MTDDTTTQQGGAGTGAPTDSKANTKDGQASSRATTGGPRKTGGPGGDRRGGRGQGRTRRVRREGKDRPRSEFDQKTILIRRVARVMAGGRRFSFSVTVVLGNKKGKVGVGLGKAQDTALAMEKAAADAKRRMIVVPMNARRSIAHATEAKYAAAQVMIIPSPGQGLKAGSSVRTVLELAGLTDVSAKIFSRSKNRLNNARATIKALEKVKGKKGKSESLTTSSAPAAR